MNSSRTVLVVLAILATALAIACGPRAINSPLLTTALFAQCNMTFDRETVWAVNYRGGAPIPVGSKVQVVQVTAEMITFKVEETGVTLKFMNHRSSGMGIEDAFKVHFAPDDPAARIAALTPEEQERVKANEVVAGMTREAVLLTYGTPPPHETPSLEMRTWTYWRNKMFKIEVNFDESGLVMEGAPPAPAGEPPAEEPEVVYFAQCNVHQEDNEVSWANYLKGPIIKLGTTVEVTAKGADEVEFKDIGTGMEYEFTNESDKSGQPTWELFLRIFATEDPTPRLEALSEADKTAVLGANVKKGMSREAVAMAWCPAPPHETPAFESDTWIYWTSRVNRAKVKFGDDGKVKSVKQ
jgi:outer membrane protein assembly factor BamE (lipoprotein component of BamABCDE complex)